MVQDGRFIVEISADGMAAYGTFVPPVGEEAFLSFDEVEYQLKANGVVQGVLWEEIRKYHKLCLEEKKIIRNVLVARGSAPRPAVPATLLFHPSIQGLDEHFLPPEKLAKKLKEESSERLTAPDGEIGAKPEDQPALRTFLKTDPFAAFGTLGEKKRPEPASDDERRQEHESPGAPVKTGSLDDQGNIDFREISGLFIIHEGQILAVSRRAIEGIAGTSVRGEYIPFSSLPASGMNPGACTELRDGKIFATKSGKFSWNSGSFWVEETLELTEDIGYKTGNIRFPGNLVLKSGIKDRFKLWVGGNLDAEYVLDAYEIFCGSDLSARGGIIGRGKGLVRVKGKLTAKFLEHCNVENLGDCFLEAGSLNSYVFCLGSLKTSEKGRLVGGKVQSRQGIEVFQAGNTSGIPTHVSVGENYVMHRKLDYARDKYQQILLAYNKVTDRLKKGADRNLDVQAQRLKSEVDKYQTMMVDILSEINDNEDATLTVTGTIYPGAVVEICRVTYTITKELKAVRFSLHKESGKVKIENIQAARTGGHTETKGKES